MNIAFLLFFSIVYLGIAYWGYFIIGQARKKKKEDKWVYPLVGLIFLVGGVVAFLVNICTFLPETEVGQLIGYFVMPLAVPLLIILFFAAGVLIIVFGVWSYLSGETFVKVVTGAVKIKGANAKVWGIIYASIGIVFLFLLLNFAYNMIF